MKLEATLHTAISGVIRDVKNVVTNCKLHGRIAAEEQTIETLTREIGTLALHHLDQGAAMAPEIMERYQAVKESRSAIKTANCEKHSVKVVCSQCGAKTTTGMHFCGACGAEMEV